jgi:hypothetical protein
MENLQSFMEERSPLVAALLTFVVLVVVGVVVMLLGLTLIGIIIFVGSIPAAFVAWMAAG